MARSRASIYLDARFGDHHPRHGVRELHPDNHERYLALVKAVAAHEKNFARPSIPEFDPTWALRVHSARYVEGLAALDGREHFAFDEDTSLSSGSVAATRAAASALVDAVDGALSGEHPRSFVLARPPGHHAGHEEAMGFCLLNHVAVAAAHARARGLERVLILDWDVHRGNGSADLFADNAGVFVVDLHQAGHWPGGGELEERGTGAGFGRTLNLPIPVASGDAAFAAVFDRVVEPAVADFSPELILVSAGFDAHAADPLGDLQCTASGFAQLLHRTRYLADVHAEGRLVLNLEGGYSPEALGDCVSACLAALAAAQTDTGVLGAPKLSTLSTSVQALCEAARDQLTFRADTD
jgi:acetoin utilization deacetylase AcuC-like enzyme